MCVDDESMATALQIEMAQFGPTRTPLRPSGIPEGLSVGANKRTPSLSAVTIDNVVGWHRNF